MHYALILFATLFIPACAPMHPSELFGDLSFRHMEYHEITVPVCEVPWLAEVDAATFFDVTGMPSCYESVRPAGKACARGVTYITDAGPVIIVPKVEEDPHNLTKRVMKHELTHVQFWCETGDPDGDHEAAVWKTI